MFSDKFRFTKIFILTACLAVLIYYAQIQGPKAIPGLKEFKKNPAVFINKELEIGGKIKKISPDSFIVEQVLDGEKSLLSVKGKLLKGKLEDNLQAVVVYKEDKTLNLERYIISNSRPIKIVISFIALLWVAYIFLKEYYFDFRKMEFKNRLG